MRFKLSIFAFAIMPLLCIAGTGSSKAYGDDAWPDCVQGFWLVTKSSSLTKNAVDEISEDRDLLIIEGARLILVTIDSVLPSALQYEARCSDSDALEGFFKLPNSQRGKIGDGLGEITEFPLKIAVIKDAEPLRIKLTFRIDEMTVKYQAIQLSRNRGNQMLVELLDSEFLCPPFLRELLKNISQRPAIDIK